VGIRKSGTYRLLGILEVEIAHAARFATPADFVSCSPDRITKQFGDDRRTTATSRGATTISAST
jgi:hypothetical protein